MAETPARQTTLVVAAIIVHQQRVLVTQRMAGSHLAGAWEFPGGKVEPDEDPRDALVRELREELGIEIELAAIVDVAFHRYPIKTVLILFYLASLKPNSPPPSKLQVAAMQWRASAELLDNDFPAADARVLNEVRRLLGG